MCMGHVKSKAHDEDFQSVRYIKLICCNSIIIDLHAFEESFWMHDDAARKNYVKWRMRVRLKA